VADSQESMLDANFDSLENLQENLSELNINLDEIPYIFQYNKRDLPNILPVEELNKALNKAGIPYFESIAFKGIGVIETLKGISKLALIALRKKTGEIGQEEEEEAVGSEESEVEFDVEEDYLNELEDEDAFEEDLQEDTIDLEDDAESEELSEEKEIEDLDLEDKLEEEFSEENIDEVEEIKDESDSTKDEFEDSFEIDLEDEEELEKSEPISVRQPAKVVKADGKVVVKDVTQKVVVPVFLRKDEELKDININLKLEIECHIIKGEPKKK
jgi:hypothetical protein